MKKIYWLVFVLLFSCGKNNREEECDCECAQSWDYPVKPGTAEWNRLGREDRNELFRLCQIPDNIINCLSTEKLLDLCLEYPYLTGIFSMNIFDMGVDGAIQGVNGTRELFKREDVVHYMLKKYMEKIQNLSFLDVEEEKYSMVHLLFKLSIKIMDGWISRLEGNDETLKEILRTLITGYEKIVSTKMIGGSAGELLVFNFYSRAYTIKKMCPKCIEEIPKNEMSFIFTPCGLPNSSRYVYDLINELSYKLIEP